VAEKQYGSKDELWNDIQIGLREGPCCIVYESDKARSRNVMLLCTLHSKLIPCNPPRFEQKHRDKWPSVIAWDLVKKKWAGVQLDRILSFSRVEKKI
jgi:hypothetical protein